MAREAEICINSSLRSPLFPLFQWQFSSWTWIIRFSLHFLPPFVQDNSLGIKWHRFFYRPDVTQPMMLKHWRKCKALTTVSRLTLLPQAVNCGRFCFWCRQSVVFSLCMKYLQNCRTNLCQIHMEAVFGPSLGWGWWSELRGQGHVACVRFVFAKTSLASSSLFIPH